MFTQEDMENAVTEIFLTCLFPPILFFFLLFFINSYLNFHRRLGWHRKKVIITDDDSTRHEHTTTQSLKSEFVPYQGITNVPFKTRMRNNLPVAVKWLRHSTLGLFFILPIVAAHALPGPSNLCYRSFEGHFYDEPAWTVDCEEYANYQYDFVGDYTGQFEPQGPFFETRATMWHFFIVCPLVLYFMVSARHDEKRHVEDKAVSFVYWSVALNLVLIFVYSLALLYNIGTLPDANVALDGSGPEAHELITEWQDAHNFHAMLPMVSWCVVGVPVAMVCGWLEESSKPTKEPD